MPKRSLVRIVRSHQGIQVDPTGKLAGRGAYLHDRPVCWEVGLGGALAHALKTEITDDDLIHLTTFARTLTERDN